MFSFTGANAALTNAIIDGALCVNVTGTADPRLLLISGGAQVTLGAGASMPNGGIVVRDTEPYDIEGASPAIPLTLTASAGDGRPFIVGIEDTDPNAPDNVYAIHAEATVSAIESYATLYSTVALNYALKVDVNNSDRIYIARKAKPMHNVYLDGANGNDANDGSSTGKAVKTFERACSLLAYGTDAEPSTILVCGQVTLPGEVTITLPESIYGNAKVRRNSGYTGYILSCVAFADMTNVYYGNADNGDIAAFNESKDTSGNAQATQKTDMWCGTARR